MHIRRAATALAILFAAHAHAQPKIQLASPAPRVEGFFGQALAMVPDCTGDTRPDVVVGAWGDGPFDTSPGGAYIYSGANGAFFRSLTPPSGEPFVQFGVAVDGIPDVNGDGRGDVIVGAPQDGPDELISGRAYIYSGLTGALLRVLKSPGQEVDGYFGGAVAGVPDLDNDGRGDVVVGAPYEDPGNSPVNCGRAYVFSGRTGALLFKILPPLPEANGNFGWSVAGLASINGDTRGDFVVGAVNEDPGNSPGDCGRAHVYSGLDGTRIRTLASPGQETNAHFGTAVASVPDITADGKPEIIVGSPGESPGGSPTNCGRAYIYNGATGALLRKLLPPTPELDGFFGATVGGVKDRNGDGKGDAIVGAPGEDPGGSPGQAGRAYIYNGATGARLTTIISPQEELDGQFGWGVAGIGDVNNDGKGDVLVGAAGEDPGNSPKDCGRAYIVR